MLFAISRFFYFIFFLFKLGVSEPLDDFVKFDCPLWSFRKGHIDNLAGCFQLVAAFNSPAEGQKIVCSFYLDSGRLFLRQTKVSHNVSMHLVGVVAPFRQPAAEHPLVLCVLIQGVENFPVVLCARLGDDVFTEGHGLCVLLADEYMLC